MRKLYTIAFLFFIGLNLTGQRAQEFWFVAPDITDDHGDEPIHMRVSTFDGSATITLELPAFPGFAPLSVTLGPNSSHNFNLTSFKDTIESVAINSVLNNGIRVTATSDISAYYEVAPSNNTDIFALKGNNAMGTDFFVSAQYYWKNGNYSPQPYSTTHVVASEDNTQVTITPTEDLVGHNAGQPFTITLQRGETYTIRADGTDPEDRFPGTRITSTKPIAVTIADDSMEDSYYGGCKDVGGDQTIPVDRIGKEYIIMRGFLERANGNQIGPDRVFVMAREDSTTVDFNGPGNQQNLNAGESFEYELRDPTVYIESNKDIYVLHVTGFGCEVGMAIVPSIVCTGSEEVSFSRSQGGDFYMIVLVPNGAQGHFTINGDGSMLEAGDFNAVPNTNDNWRYARKSFNATDIQVNQNYRVKNSKSFFHMGIINGGKTTGCLYGYFSDFGGVETGPIFRY